MAVTILSGVDERPNEARVATLPEGGHRVVACVGVSSRELVDHPWRPMRSGTYRGVGVIGDVVRFCDSSLWRAGCRRAACLRLDSRDPEDSSQVLQDLLKVW